jgi:hypothetical protein
MQQYARGRPSAHIVADEQSTVRGHSARMHAPYCTTLLLHRVQQSAKLCVPAPTAHAVPLPAAALCVITTCGRQCVTPPRHRGSWCNTSCTHFRESARRNKPWGLPPQRLHSVRTKHLEHMQLLNAAICSSATEFGAHIVADELWTATIHGSWTLGAHACHMP